VELLRPCPGRLREQPDLRVQRRSREHDRPAGRRRRLPDRGTTQRILFNADGGGAFYFDLEDRNTYFYSGGLSWLHRFSQRTLFTLTEGLTNDYGQKSPVLVAEGILRPLDRALTSRTTATLRQTLSPVFGLEARAQYDHVDFSSPTLADGDQIEAQLALNRRYGERYAASLSYQFLSSHTGGQPRRNYHSGYLGGSKRLSLTAMASVNLGVMALPQEGGGWRVVPSALARLHALNARTHLRIDARYEHKANQDFGLGTDRIADIVALALERPFGRRWSSNLGLNYTLSKDTGTQLDQNESFRYTSQSLSAGLAYQATRRLSLDLGYSYFRSTQMNPAVDDHTVNLGVTYRKEPE
jgi:hypothetical protein